MCVLMQGQMDGLLTNLMDFGSVLQYASVYTLPEQAVTNRNCVILH